MKQRRKISPLTGKPYPKCSHDGCNNNVYANGKCWSHQIVKTAAEKAK